MSQLFRHQHRMPPKIIISLIKESSDPITLTVMKNFLKNMVPEERDIKFYFTTPEGRTFIPEDNLRRSSSLPNLGSNLVYVMRWIAKVKKKLLTIKHCDPLDLRKENPVFYSTLSLSKLQGIMRKRHSSPEVLEECFRP